MYNPIGKILTHTNFNFVHLNRASTPQLAHITQDLSVFLSSESRFGNRTRFRYTCHPHEIAIHIIE